jgi:hypothetical protein
LNNGEHKPRASFMEYAVLLLVGALSFLLARNLHERGIPLKWATAIMGTVVIFAFVIYVCGNLLTRWAFWVAVAICFLVHIVVTWMFFQLFLSGFERFSILCFYPLMLIEVFVLLVAVKRIHDKLTGNHETLELKM